MKIKPNHKPMIKKKNLTPQEELDEEYMRAFINSFLSPEYDDFIPLEDDSYFEKIYGKANWAKTKEKWQEKPEDEKGINLEDRKG